MPPRCSRKTSVEADLRDTEMDRVHVQRSAFNERAAIACGREKQIEVYNIREYTQFSAENNASISSPARRRLLRGRGGETSVSRVGASLFVSGSGDLRLIGTSGASRVGAIGRAGR